LKEINDFENIEEENVLLNSRAFVEFVQNLKRIDEELKFWINCMKSFFGKIDLD